MSKGGNRAVETSQQRALAERAAALYADYQARWLPVQKGLARQVVADGARGSVARERAAGRASTDNAIAFSEAQGAVERGLSAAGAAPGSARFNLAATGAGDDAATSRGLGMMVADQMVDDAYTQGLAALAAIGRGERGQVVDSLGRQAAQSGVQARADAEASTLQRVGNAEIAGTVAGYGLRAAMQRTEPGADLYSLAPTGGERPNGAGLTFSSATLPTYDFGDGVSGTGMTPYPKGRYGG